MAHAAPVPATRAPVVEVRDVSKSFTGVQALADVSFRADAGEILGLVGENGAGKSTLIKILSGALGADGGSLLIDGQVVQIRDPLDAARQGIVAVYQEFNLQPKLTVAENLLFGDYPRVFGVIRWAQVREEAAAFLDGFGLSVPVDTLVADLSIAERQMLEIAKALRQRAKVLILDEPTAVLGGSDVDHLMQKIRGLRDQGLAIIFISHRLNEVLTLADRYVVLKDGVKVGEGRILDTDHDDLVRKMVGRELASVLEAKGGRPAGDEVLRVEALSRGDVLRDVSFTLRRGEILGVAGLRGAGRTELARAIVGADPADSGTIHVRGRSVRIASPADAAKLGIGLLPEDRAGQGLLLNLSVAENVALARIACSSTSVLRPRAERKVAETYVDRLDIRVSDVGESVRNLSGGNQQKVVVAKLLEAGVTILVLDEPTRGIDVASKAELYQVMRRACEGGMAILLISSELPEVLAMSDRILVMHRGRVTATLDGQTATEEAVMRHAVGEVA
jgi:ABC-type sugar transport system ATPase subunit